MLRGVLEDFIIDGPMAVACPEIWDDLRDVLRELEPVTSVVGAKL